MGIIDCSYYDNYAQKVTLALGQFDAMHVGHVQLLQECKKYNAKVAMFTFTGNPRGMLGGDGKQIFTFSERLMRMQRLGVDVCIHAEVKPDILNMSGEEFLSGLFQRFNIERLVIGADYRCGKNASYNSSDIVEFSKKKGVAVSVIELLNVEGRKISSTHIRGLIECGNVEEVNKLLSQPYSISGRVVEGRSAGKGILGFPTANIEIPSDKIVLKEGVYMTKVRYLNVDYPSITNVGRHPTFDDYHYNVESFILDFDGNLYGKDIETVFIKRLRDTVKFENADALKRQISEDIARIRREL